MLPEDSFKTLEEIDVSDKKFEIVNLQHSEITDRIADDLRRGVSRRDVMRTLLA
jgi:hypothetical protein